MPSITTHFIHSDEVYKRLKKDTQKDLEDKLNIYHVFAQSHDIFFYSPNKEIKALGRTGHHKKTKAYLMNIVKNIIDNNLQEDTSTLAYLYGSITHYVLDTTCHPYIFYKTGIYKHNKETLKYRGLHSKMERDIDAIYYEKYYKKPYKYFNISKEIINNPDINTNLSSILDKTYKETYDFDDASMHLKKCLKYLKLISNLICKDKIGIKYHLINVVDKISHNHLSSYSNFHKVNRDYLNLKHKTWTHPSNDKEKHNESFDDLFELATKKAVTIIETAHNVIINNQDIDKLDKLITNIDYSTGLDVDNNKGMKYFDF